MEERLGELIFIERRIQPLPIVLKSRFYSKFETKVSDILCITFSKTCKRMYFCGGVGGELLKMVNLKDFVVEKKINLNRYLSGEPSKSSIKLYRNNGEINHPAILLSCCQGQVRIFDALLEEHFSFELNSESFFNTTEFFVLDDGKSNEITIIGGMSEGIINICGIDIVEIIFKEKPSTEFFSFEIKKRTTVYNLIDPFNNTHNCQKYNIEKIQQLMRNEMFVVAASVSTTDSEVMKQIHLYSTKKKERLRCFKESIEYFQSFFVGLETFIDPRSDNERILSINTSYCSIYDIKGNTLQDIYLQESPKGKSFRGRSVLKITQNKFFIGCSFHTPIEDEVFCTLNVLKDGSVGIKENTIEWDFKNRDFNISELGDIECMCWLDETDLNYNEFLVWVNMSPSSSHHISVYDSTIPNLFLMRFGERCSRKEDTRILSLSLEKERIRFLVSNIMEELILSDCCLLIVFLDNERRCSSFKSFLLL